ncbi:integrin alpha-5 [Daphnia magna]|uniref:integrin alpha-5 n=1 Tax=Daphnia magna TaxID=35525 RepID=UPI001E1BCBDD|nr:integrin alpha-5 [Daphnia magna]
MMVLRRIIRSFLILFLLAVPNSTVWTWNLDVREERIFRSLPKSYFGYSLNVYQPNETVTEWLVGSPGENSFGGALYKCRSLDGEAGFGCDKVELMTRNRNAYIIPKNGWLGATVASSGGFVLVCSPRAGPQTEGDCYSSENNLNSFSKIQLPYPRRVCLSGFSATYSPSAKTPRKPFLGGPTCYHKDKPSTSSSLIFPALYPELDQWYLGYAMASGIFGIRQFEQGEFLLLSVAFHIASSFTGKVYLLKKETKQELASLLGSQPGEHFGASLAVSDINGDGRDDIIVGAPHYTDYESTDLKVEIGAVYIYYQTSNNTYEQNSSQELKGQVPGGRFGYAVAGIGDTDADGFNDVAIGAPYENEGFGTVYIYYGTNNGLRDRPSQVIFGNAFNPPIQTFGFAITGGDFDGNKYSDVVVGGFESAAVAYIPARPIAKINSKLNFVSEKINLEKTSQCSITNSSDGVTKIPVACDDISFCITYSGLSVADQVELRVSILLDSNAEKGSRRIFFYENKQEQFTQDIIYKAGFKKCLSRKFYVTPEIQDTASTAQARMTIELTTKIPEPNQLLPMFAGNFDKIFSNNSLVFMVSGKTSSFADATPWWIYLVSALGAVLILSIITGVLYKLGFFKRKLPPTEQKEEDNVTQASTDGM